MWNTSKGVVSKWEHQIERGNLCMCKFCTHIMQKDQTTPYFFTGSPFLPISIFMKNLNSASFLLLSTFYSLNKGRGFQLCKHLPTVFIVNFEHIQSNIQNVKCCCWNFEQCLCPIFNVDCKFFCLVDIGQMFLQVI